MPKVSRPASGKSARTTPYNPKDHGTSTVSTRTASAQPTQNAPPIVNYLFSCTLDSSRNPVISRFLSIPSNFTFDDLHVVMQAAFGWGMCHVWNFDLRKVLTKAEEKQALRTIGGTAPLMSWNEDGDGMDDFFPGPGGKTQVAHMWKLSDVFEKSEYRSKTQLHYEYDMGHGWEHSIVLIGVEDPGFRKALKLEGNEDAPVCFGGEGHACAEDCGGPMGWEDLKDLFKKKGSRDPDGRKEWYKTHCMNGERKGGLDPYAWDIQGVNQNLLALKKSKSAKSTQMLAEELQIDSQTISDGESDDKSNDPLDDPLDVPLEYDLEDEDSVGASNDDLEDELEGEDDSESDLDNVQD